LIPPDNSELLKKSFITIANETQKNEVLANNLNTFVEVNYAPEKVIQSIIMGYKKYLSNA